MSFDISGIKQGCFQHHCLDIQGAGFFKHRAFLLTHPVEGGKLVLELVGPIGCSSTESCFKSDSAVEASFKISCNFGRSAVPG